MSQNASESGESIATHLNFNSLQLSENVPLKGMSPVVAPICKSGWNILKKSAAFSSLFHFLNWSEFVWARIFRIRFHKSLTKYLNIIFCLIGRTLINSN